MYPLLVDKGSNKTEFLAEDDLRDPTFPTKILIPHENSV
jgi:hypothetical protein